MAGKWQEKGSIRLSKAGKLYIKLDDVSGLKDGVVLVLEKTEDELNRLHELGYIKDEELEKRMELATWLKYKIKLAPPQE